MLNRILFVLFFLNALMVCPFFSCKKHTNNLTIQLPPATQSGAQTLGFLLNGKAWTPAGNDGTPKLAASYDEGYKDGSLTISAHKIISDSIMQFFSFSIDTIQTTGVFTKQHKDFGFHYSNTQGCDYFSGDDANWQGTLQITKLDKANGIVSGIFACLLITPGCDTIKITDGRFNVLF